MNRRGFFGWVVAVAGVIGLRRHRSVTATEVTIEEEPRPYSMPHFANEPDAIDEYLRYCDQVNDRLAHYKRIQAEKLLAWKRLV